MLDAIGYTSLDDLLADAVPAGIREKLALALPPAASEAQAAAELRALAARNQVLTSMIGLGYYDTITPAVIRRNVLESPAWYTAYTPYQPEISQGRLEALLNFQTMVEDLTGLPVAGASVLDEGTAAAEAMALAHRAVEARHRLRRRRRRLPADHRRDPHPRAPARARGRRAGPRRAAAGRHLRRARAVPRCVRSGA